jgi:hypothetical protein
MLFWIPACAGMTAGLLPTLFLESAAAASVPLGEEATGCEPPRSEE